jgi:signal transduction histidine kinase
MRGHCAYFLIALLLMSGISWRVHGAAHDVSADQLDAFPPACSERAFHRRSKIALPAAIAGCASPTLDETSPSSVSKLLQRYRTEFFIAVAAVFVQASLIVLLLIERRRRRTAELNANLRLAELSHMNRAAELGEMSAAIAHELGQPIAAILVNAEAATLLLAQQPPQIEAASQAIRDIARDNKNAADVIRRITALYRKTELTTTRIDVNALITEVIRITAREAAHRNVEIALDLEAGVPDIDGDRIQLEQVVLNLLRNAMDAIPDDSALRRVIISTSKDDHRVRISISDSGVGIPKEIEAQIFKPFFTTKDHGIGMGLAISKRIVEAHNGRLDIFSSSLGGAQLAFELPTKEVS